MSRSPEVVDLAYDAVKVDSEHHKAVCFQFGDKEVWLPHSLIELDTDAKVVTVPVWKAEMEGIEGYAE
jgi:hypothetical protein